MYRTTVRAIAVAALVLGGLAAIPAPVSAAPPKCIINGVPAPCQKPDYENDCEGALQRPDCATPPPPAQTEPAPEPTQTQAQTSGGTSKAAGSTTGSASTTTQTGQTVTTTTVDANGAVTTVTEQASAYYERKGMARLGADTT